MFIAFCVIALFPISEGIQGWLQFRNPDNLAIGIGIGIIMFLGLPSLCVSIFLYNLSKKNNRITKKTI